MALTTYSGLQTALSVWLDGSSFSSREADFITLCEAEMNATLSAAIRGGSMIRPMMQKDTISITAEYVDMPDGRTILPVSIEVTGLDRRWQIAYIDPDSLVRMKYGEDEERNAVNSLAGAEPPRFYTLVGDQMRFFPEPESTFAAQLTRLVKIPALSDDNTSNWVLASHPNAYLYGALAQAEMFGWNDAGMANWATLFANAVQGIGASYPAPSSNAPLRSELAAFRGGGQTYSSFMAGT
jgi:hypothetical protein